MPTELGINKSSHAPRIREDQLHGCGPEYVGGVPPLDGALVFAALLPYVRTCVEHENSRVSHVLPTCHGFLPQFSALPYFLVWQKRRCFEYIHIILWQIALLPKNGTCIYVLL